MDRSPGESRTTRGYATTKRAIDLAICIVALPVLLPIGLLCALAIRVETPGPILFAQQRTGQHGVRFPMFKFRTMVRNAEELKASLQHLNILPPPDFTTLFCIRVNPCLADRESFRLLHVKDRNLSAFSVNKPPELSRGFE